MLSFKIVPESERYYSEETNWGVYTFSTTDNIPEYSTETINQFGVGEKKKFSVIAGKMQRLYLGSDYEVQAELSYDTKYKAYQYKPKVISAVSPKTEDQQRRFLESLVTEKQAETLLAAYPNIIEDTINNKEINVKKLRGIREHTWEIIKEKIINNYVISDILILLQPLGVSFAMIQKLISEEPNPALLKAELLDNPYIMTRIRGLGFKKVDALALKLNPDIRVSSKRTYAFIKHFFKELGNNVGHTWVTESVLENAIIDNINECIDKYHEVIEFEKNTNMVLHFEDDKVGLKSYWEVETRLLDTLNSLNQYKRKWNIDIDAGVKEAEEAQGFDFTGEQKEKIVESTKSNVVLISGKAGTGKTTIARALLAIYKNYSISCCALSAKAAQRITEATGYPASTIHRLLQSQGTKFLRCHDNPLDADVILVDECSMINSEIFLALVTAIREGSKVILCGDNRQLPPIGYGNIFSDLLNMDEVFNVNKLTHVLRQAEKSGILSDANKIRDGINPLRQPELKVVTGEMQDMTYMFRDNRNALQSIAIKTYLKAIQTDGLDDVVIITPRKSNCINCTADINRIIQDELIDETVKCISYGDRKYKLGAKVIQRENNYNKNVFNGEIGYISKIWDESVGKERHTYFEISYNNGDKIVQYTRSEVDQIDWAYALTVHLSQGSGYKTVISIIDNTHYTLLDTCLLYTALTRAKKRCLLLAEPNAFKRCINNNNSVNRQTWLGLMAKNNYS